MPNPDDPIIDKIPCECGAKDCEKGLLLRKYPGDKIKIQIFAGEDIKTVVVSKDKLMKELEKLK